MTIQGTIVNGAVVLDQPVPAPDGTRVEVTVQPEKPKAGEGKPTLLGLLELAGTVNDLPTDMALNHDHYLHGHPKK